AKDSRQNDADDKPTDPQAARYAACAKKSTGVAAEPAEARRMHARLYHDSEEAQFGIAQSREGAAHKWFRGDRLHPGRGSQSAGTFRGDDPRWTREGSARRAVPRPARRAGHAGGKKSQAEALQIRSQTTQVIGSF